MAQSSFLKSANIVTVLTCLLAVTQLIATAGHAGAQSPAAGQGTGFVASGSQVRLPGHMAPEVMNGTASPLGHYDPTQKLRLAVVLALPHPAEEQQFLADVYDKKSPLFHQFLSQEEWVARFGPTAESEQAVVDWAQSQGLTVSHRYNNRLVVDLEAPAGTIEQVLNVTINSYQLPPAHGDDARTVFSNDRDPSIPSNLSGVIDAVLGLNSIVVMRPSGGSGHLSPRPDYLPGQVVQAGGSLQKEGHRGSLELSAGSSAAAVNSNSGTSSTNGTSTPNGYTPQYFWNSDAYNYQALMNQGHCCNPLNNSSGHSPRESSIAIASFADVNFNDINAFQAYFSNLATNVDKIFIDGTYVCGNNDDGCSEVTMDTEWSLATANSQGAVADTARVVVYEGANYDNATIMDVYNQMEDDAHARTMTTSWGVEENIQFSSNPEMDTYNSTMYSIDKIFASMSGEGWTLVAASGDQGATGGCTQALAVQFPSSDWYVVGAGGTELSEGNPYEVAWTGATYQANPNANPPTADACDNNSGGSTGGFSEYFPAPSFQSGMGFSKRAVPDLALDTTHGHDVYFQGSWIHPGGTSVAAPMLAGFFAQANAYLLSVGDICGSGGNAECAPIGNANFPIYDEGKNPNAAHYPFYDITEGCNSNDITVHDPSLKPYCAGPGYDEVTGWGSANMLQLAWAINWELIPASGEPYITWSGPEKNKWYNTNQTVNWKITDYVPSGDTPSSGIAGEEQGWDSLPEKDSYREPHGGSGDSFWDGPQFPNGSTGCLAFEPNGCSGGVSQGCHTAWARGWNNQGWNTSGNSSYPESYGPICYDTVAPNLNVTLTPPAPSSTGWYRTPVTISMSANDPGGNNASGVANIYYGIGTLYCTTTNMSGCSTYGSPVTLNTSQLVGVDAFSEDKAGNFSSAFGKAIAVDMVPPVTTAGFNGPLVNNMWTNSVTIILKGTDDFSGVKTTYYTLDGGAQTAYTAPITIAKVGSHTIYYWSIDYAGNVEQKTGETFQVSSSTAIKLAATPNPSTPGKVVTLVAKITATDPGTPTGTVTFLNSGTALGTVTPANGVATFTTSAIPLGLNYLAVTYNGSTNYTQSVSAVLNFTVHEATTTTLTVAPTTPVPFGATVNLTAKVAASISGTPTGNVNFYVGPELWGTAPLNSSGIATFPANALTAGVNSLRAEYMGDSSYISSISATKSVTVDKATSATALKSSTKTSSYDEIVTLTATVTSKEGTPPGTVFFYSNKVPVGSGPLVDGVAALSTKALRVGTDSVTALYYGSADFSDSTSAAVSVDVAPAPTNTKLASSLNPSTFGTFVTLTATVTAPPGPPPGTVEFRDGPILIGKETLVADKAVLLTSLLAGGPHSITASFVASTDYAASTSAALVQTVDKATTATALASSLNPGFYDEPVILSATVTSATGKPAGAVTFHSGTRSLGAADLVDGVAKVTLRSMELGTASLTATYDGSVDFSTSTSTAVSQTTDRAATTTAVTSSLNPSTSGASVTFTATITSAGGDAPGTVTFKDGTKSLGTVSEGGGKAVLTTTKLAAGTHSITAIYNGGINFTGSTSAALTQTVNGATAAARVVYVPDYYGQLLQVRVGTTSPTAITIDLPSCNPNSVAVNSNKVYVVCNASGDNPDKILVYDASTIRSAPAGTLTISPLQTITSTQFSSLIGITFDSSNNLWVASYGNSQVDEITTAALATTTPAVTASLVNSPGSPVSLAFDTNGSLWVTGQYAGGILLNFPSSQLGQGANAVPDYCAVAANLGSGCQNATGLFLNPEGLALFNGDVWIANNATGADGNVPARQLIDVKYSGGSATAVGTLTLNATFGNSTVPADSPFVCPGGLFAGSVHLWVNDESYGEANPQCGAAGDVASQTGGVFDFTAAQLTAQTTTASQVLAYSNITGRPGFGGIFVENDQ